MAIYERVDAMKQKESKFEHEEKYIDFLEKQIIWKSEHPERCLVPDEVKTLKYKLSKARLILKILKG
jgi:heme oxygenase